VATNIYKRTMLCNSKYLALLSGLLEHSLGTVTFAYGMDIYLVYGVHVVFINMYLTANMSSSSLGG